MVFPDHLFHLVGGRAGKHLVERWEFWELGWYGIFSSAAYALGGRSHHQKGGMA